MHNIRGLKASYETLCNVKEGLGSQLINNDVETSKIRLIVEAGMTWSVGCGESILFWHDKWCEGGPLKRLFPNLFVVSSQKNLFINQMGH